ncbi:chaperonin 10-like protein, partial [Mycena crocata]
MAVQQKALAVTHKDKPFTLIRHAVPTPGPGDLLVKVEGAALKPGEWKLQTGGYPMFLGTDGAGTVVEVGEGVETFKKGDRV